MPVVPGHEPLGRIAKIGDRAARRWKVDVGDRVAVETMLSCRHCGPCLSGSYHLCDTRRIYSYIPLSEPPGLWGAYSQYMYLAPNTIVHRVDPTLPPQVAVMFNPLGAGFRWAVEMPNTRPGDSVVDTWPRTTRTRLRRRVPRGRCRNDHRHRACRGRQQIGAGARVRRRSHHRRRKRRRDCTCQRDHKRAWRRHRGRRFVIRDEARCRCNVDGASGRHRRARRCQRLQGGRQLRLGPGRDEGNRDQGRHWRYVDRLQSCDSTDRVGTHTD